MCVNVKFLHVGMYGGMQIYVLVYTWRDVMHPCTCACM